jgi:hypothetical protein
MKERGVRAPILKTLESNEIEGSGNGIFLYRAP